MESLCTFDAFDITTYPLEYRVGLYEVVTRQSERVAGSSD